MKRAVQLRESRSRRWAEEGERPLWKNLSMVGALGWLIVIPTLLGVLAGRWLDGVLGTGTLFTGALIFIGVVIGGVLAWQRINSE
jgi:ATP synthase protein I